MLYSVTQGRRDRTLGNAARGTRAGRQQGPAFRSASLVFPHESAREFSRPRKVSPHAHRSSWTRRRKPPTTSPRRSSVAVMAGRCMIIPTSPERTRWRLKRVPPRVLFPQTRRCAALQAAHEPLPDLWRERLYRPPHCDRSPAAGSRTGTRGSQRRAGSHGQGTRPELARVRSFRCRRAAARIRRLSARAQLRGPVQRNRATVLDGLATRSHYLDITGEIDVFALCHRHHDAAVAREHRRRTRHRLRRRADRLRRRDAQAAPARCDAPRRVRSRRWTEPRHGQDQRRRARPRRPCARCRELVDVPLAWKSRTFQRDDAARSA